MTFITSDTPTPLGTRDVVRNAWLSRISWGAVLAGVVLALASHLILNMIGIAIGAGTVNATANDVPDPDRFSIMAALWWTASGIVAAFIGGFTAGRLCGVRPAWLGAWHGVASWALTTLIVVYLMGTAVGAFVSGTMGAVSQATSRVADIAGESAKTAVQATAPGLAASADPFGRIEQSIRQATGGTDPSALRDAAIATVRAALTGDQSKATEARERAADAISKAQGISIEQARTQIAEYEADYKRAIQEAKDTAKKAADAAAKAVSRGALVGAIALIFGAIAAMFGGRFGAITPAGRDEMDLRT